MDSAFEQLADVPGFTVPVHRALTEPILLAGAPRAFAILNGTLAGAIGLGLQLWVAGIVIGLLGHAVAVWAARCDPLFVEVGRRHLRLPGHLEVWGRTMMNLAEYRRKGTRLADYLPWAALVAPGVVLNKDGSLQRSARFRGPDLDSAVAAELVAVAGRVNNAFRRLGSGWAIFVEAQRVPAADYPDSRFPDPASALLDAERRARFAEQGAHFQSEYLLTFLYLPPAEEAARAETWLYEGRDKTGIDAGEVLRGFIDRTDRVLALFDGIMPECRWMDDSETLTYLHSTISTQAHRVRVPKTPGYLDALLADQPLTAGFEPRLGDAHLRVLTLSGFPTATTPGILDDLNRLAFPYRWATRAIQMDKTEATRMCRNISSGLFRDSPGDRYGKGPNAGVFQMPAHITEYSFPGVCRFRFPKPRR